jgi:hypothetical protein
MRGGRLDQARENVKKVRALVRRVENRGYATLGRLADATSIEYVYRLCAYLPLIGLLTAFLPDLDQPATAHEPAVPVR